LAPTQFVGAPIPQILFAHLAVMPRVPGDAPSDCTEHAMTSHVTCQCPGCAAGEASDCVS
jgi:hypothetical protein